MNMAGILMIHIPYRTDEYQEVRNNVGYLQSIVEGGEIKACSWQGRFPELLQGNTDRNGQREDTHRPDYNNSHQRSHLPSEIWSGRRSKNAVILEQDRQLDACNARSIDVVPSVLCLLTSQR